MNVSKDGYLTYPVLVGQTLWALHFLTFAFLLAMWAHFNALNIISDAKHIFRFSWIHGAPLGLLTVVTLTDIPLQRFYPVNAAYEHLLPGAGTYCMIGLSVYYALAMVIPTLYHRKDLQGPFLFVSFLLPATFLVSLISFWATHSYALFMVVNAFMLVLHYLIGQRDSFRVDDLTGLPSSSLLQRNLIRIFRTKASYVLILIDIENFRNFNVRYGRQLGDKMLVALAGFLSTLGSWNEVFRLESDRFCLCMPALGKEGADALIARIQERMGRSWELEGAEADIQVNLAVISIPEQVCNLEELEQATDRLFMEMKTGRKDSVIVHTREDSIIQQQKLNIITALRNSVRHPEQVRVVYQPIYELENGRMISAEALMRIEDRHLGWLEPADFIALAEQTSLIVPLSHILLAEVCRMVKRIPEGSLECVAINLSGKNMELKSVGKILLGILEAEEVDPKRICFEITESVLLQSYERVAGVMQELSQQEITFALDDFGTGYSNVQALMDLPYQFVKFDKSVIQRSTDNPQMLISLVGMMGKMGKCTIAEGVETDEELLLVRDIGFDRAQGFILSKPLDGEALLELLGRS